MLNLKKSEWFVLISLLLLSFIPSLGVFRLAELGLGTDLEFLPANPRAKSAPIPIYFHIVSSILFCILGAFQFLSSIRNNHPIWHRYAGRLIIVAGVVSALSGLWMTHYYAFPESLQGNLLYTVRVVVSISMTLFILLGLFSILKRKFVQHQAWMIRAYALGQGAGTQALISIPLVLTAGEPSGFSRDILMTAAWVINIAASEWIITRRRVKVTS
jgi:hypothetical protein